MVPLGVLKPALVCPKRWRLGEKDAKGTQSGILEGVSGVGTLLVMVRQLLDPPGQDTLEEVEAAGGCHADRLGLTEIIT